MQKVVIHSPGDYKVLKIEEHPTPKVGDGHILLEVKACSVNYADIIVRWGLYESAKKYVGFPITPGFDVCGVIKELGAGVDKEKWKIGERVMGVTFFGGYSGMVSIPSSQIYSLPKDWSFAQGAAFPSVHLTAYHALKQLVVIYPGQRLLIHSAAGGVGSAMVQMGKILGLWVVGIVGNESKVSVVEKLGADAVIDKSHQDWREVARNLSPEGYHIVCDANGASTLKHSYDLLAPTGKLISYGFHSMFPKEGGKIHYLKLLWNYFRTPRFNPLHMTSQNKSLITFNLSFLFNRMDLLNTAMETMISWVGEKKLLTPTVTTFPLDEVDEAHKLLESGKSVGKIVLLPRENT